MNGGTDADVKSHFNKARCAFAVLKPIWKSRKMTLRTKIRLYNANVKSVLLCGCECWTITSDLATKIQVLIHKYLRIILCTDKVVRQSLKCRT